MRIAIITWFNNYNYGTYLQAFSLQAYLKQLNHEVALIRYEGTADDIIKEPIDSISVFLNKAKNNINRRAANLLYKKIVKYDRAEDTLRKKQRMDAFLSSVTFTAIVKTKEEFEELEKLFDCFICGSDQIWNPKLLNGRYYLDFVHRKGKIAYADSFSLSYLPEFAKTYIKKWLSDFVAVGMRESTGVKLVNSVWDSKSFAKNVCDPTLLLYDYWKNKIFEDKVQKNYIFSYFLGNRRYYGKILAILAKKYNSYVVSVPMNDFSVRNGDIIDYSVAVEDFLAYIQNAQFVCADSFHAMVFSVIYQKQFVALNKYKEGDLSSQNSRIKDFLTVLGLENRIISESEIYRIDRLPAIDYECVNQKLKTFILESKTFLTEALSRVEENI